MEDPSLFADNEAVVLPLPPRSAGDEMEMEIYIWFMRHLRLAQGKDADMRILASIQFAADMLNHSDAFVAKTLVDLGLRASRRAFPSLYLEHVDRCLQSGDAWKVTGKSAIVLKNGPENARAI